MIQKTTDTRQQQLKARREQINEQFCRLGDALNALPDYVFINSCRIGPYNTISFDINADAFERMFCGKEVRIRREYGWAEATCSGGDLDGVQFTASHSRYKHPVQPKDETITLPEVVS